eukprot:5695343-Amphidinium_carterae.5
MPAPKPDATHVPVESNEERKVYTVGQIVHMPNSSEGDMPQLQVPEDTQGASSSGSTRAYEPAPQQLEAAVLGQARVRGDQETDMAAPHPGSMLQSWLVSTGEVKPDPRGKPDDKALPGSGEPGGEGESDPYMNIVWRVAQ